MSNSRACARRTRGGACAAVADVLERRVLLADIFVTNANDGGGGTLRDAINAANTAQAADRILFEPGFFATPRTISLLSPLPQINGSAPLTIVGPGAALLTVRQTYPLSPANMIGSFAPVLALSGMTITGGNVNGNGGGVGIFGNSPDVTLEGLVITGNTCSAIGGGVGMANNVTLTIRDCTVTNNTAGARGGGVFFFSNGSLLMERCTVADNQANSTSAGDGGGVYFFGVASASPPPGFTPSTLVIRDSTIERNRAQVHGGGVALDIFTGTLRLEDTTVSDNTAATGEGGAVATDGPGNVLLVNSTLAGNTAVAGGGVSVTSGTGSISVHHSTVRGNTATGTAPTQGGGGLARTQHATSGSITVRNSVVAGNNATNGPDVFRFSVAATTTHVNYSALGSNAGFDLSPTSGDNLPSGANLMIGALASNGGPTRTMALLAGSPCVNAGDPAFAPPPDFDQRGPGFPRVSAGRVDIGAYERAAAPGPVVQTAEFAFLTAPQALRYAFSANVAASLTTADLLLENLTSMTTVPAGNVALAYDGATNTARFTFPGYAFGALPDGRYRATLLAAGVTDPSGNPLPSNHVLEFFFLNADANRDARVNLADFNTLASNFGQSNRNFSQADFNYDGQVNLADFNILAGRFGMAVGPAGIGWGGLPDDDDGDAGDEDPSGTLV